MCAMYLEIFKWVLKVLGKNGMHLGIYMELASVTSGGGGSRLAAAVNSRLSAGVMLSQVCMACVRKRSKGLPATGS